MFRVYAGELCFEINNNATQYHWLGINNEVISPSEHDYFRVFLDNGDEKEIAVFSKQQVGKVSGQDNDVIISYDKLIDEFNREYDIKLNIYMKSVGSNMEYYAEVENYSNVRVNEVECPFIELSKIYDNDTSKDVLFRANGPGERIINPIAHVKRRHTEYISSDYEHIWDTFTYPYHMSMPWYGIQSNEYFLYVGRHDDKFRTCAISLGCAPRFSKNEEIVFNISNFPMANKGEKTTCGKGVVSLLKGNWRTGADIYKEWANTWYFPPTSPDWIKKFTGWQRIILKHQYGRIYFKYKDLVKLYENGAKYGLDTLMVFGWWKGRFDNGYPIYEPDDELGGAEELKKAIKTIQNMGGRVILYNNGILLDVVTDYYKETGHKISKKNIDGVEYRDYYRFSDYGMTLKTFGYKTFTHACPATEEWKNKLIENAKIKLQYNPDSIFYDQIGGACSAMLCFDETHKHGKRTDEEAIYKIENVKAIRDILPIDKCIGTENLSDCVSPLFDFIHGCHMAGYGQNHFPSLYRYIFPEIIITNRFLHDEKDGFEKILNHAFVNGFRFDVSIFRGKMTDISSQPKYGEHLKYLLDIKEKYKDYFYFGTFIGDDTSFEKPFFITANLYMNCENKQILAVFNDSDKEYDFTAYGKTEKISPYGIAVIEI